MVTFGFLIAIITLKHTVADVKWDASWNEGWGCMGFKGYDNIEEYHAANPNIVRDTSSTRVNLTKSANEDGAVCIDGSVPVFYWRPGVGDGTNKFIIYFDGGGWCGGINEQVSPCQDTCAHRATTDLGSSNSYPQILDTDKGCMSTKQTVNPLAYNWNVVTMRYCDGGSYTGNNETVIDAGHGIKLHFRGWRILNGLFRTLISDYKLSSATDIVIGGCSAGGLTLYLHINYIYQTYIPSNANFMTLIDSGFFMQYEGSGKYISAMKWLWDNMNVTDSMDTECINYYNYRDDDPFNCMFAQNLSPFLNVKTFNMQSRYDSWQDGCELQSNNPSEINKYGANLTSVYQKMYEQSNGDTNANKHGSFLDSCHRHCDDGDYFVSAIDGYTPAQAEYAFYYNQNNHSRIWFQNDSYPCQSCCS